MSEVFENNDHTAAYFKLKITVYEMNVVFISSSAFGLRCLAEISVTQSNYCDGGCDRATAVRDILSREG